MENILYGITIIVYAIFIIRFILAWIGAEFDVDGEFDLNDIISFKGLNHFLMGSCGWLSLRSYIDHEIIFWDYLIAFVLGLLFTIILYLVYRLMAKLESKPEIVVGKELIGKSGTIYLTLDSSDQNYKYLITTNNGLGTVEVSAKSTKKYSIGEVVTILDYVNAYYII